MLTASFKTFRVMMLTGLMPLTVACDPEDAQVIEAFQYDVTNEQVSVEAKFNNDLELNMELIAPIRQYGEVRLFPDYQNGGFTLGFALNLDALDDGDILDIEKTRLMPNGQPMSRYVNEDLIRIRIKDDEHDVVTNVYISANEKNMFFGVAVELGFMNEDFPAALVITQRIRDTEKNMLGVVSIFGPKIEMGEVAASGGLFVMTNITDLASREQMQELSIDGEDSNSGLALETKLFVTGENSKKYSSSYKLRKIYKKLKKKAAKYQQ